MPAARAAGVVLVVGAVVTVLLVDGVRLDDPRSEGAVGYHWLPLLLGLTSLAAAAAGRSRGPLWAPGLVLAAVGATVGLWFEAGRSGDDYRLVPLVALGLGLGGVLAAALAGARDLTVGPMQVALPVVLFGALALLDQLSPGPLGLTAWPYCAAVAGYGAVLVVRGRP